MATDTKEPKRNHKIHTQQSATPSAFTRSCRQSSTSRSKREAPSTDSMESNPTKSSWSTNPWPVSQSVTSGTCTRTQAQHQQHAHRLHHTCKQRVTPFPSNAANQVGNASHGMGYPRPPKGGQLMQLDAKHCEQYGHEVTS